MRQRVFRNMSLLAVIALLLVAFPVCFVSYMNFQKEIREEIRRETTYIAAAMEENPDYAEQLPAADRNRITVIAPDGTVLYDSAASAGEMENHLERPEIQAALTEGSGESVRMSGTIDQQTFYRAVRLNDGSILRVAATTDSMFAAFAGSIPYLVLVFAAILVIALLLAGGLTKRIVKPINALDLENPLSNDTYDELSPLLSRIEKQNRQIQTQIGKLTEKQSEFSAISENMSEGMILLNPECDVLSINSSAVRLLGIPPRAYAGEHILTVSREPESSAAVEKALSGKEGRCVLKKNGRYCEWMANPVLEGESVRGVVVLILDATEKYNAEKMRREFSANVSHELKTPLQSISGYSELMKDGIAKPADVPKFAERIYHESARMIALIDDIIQLSMLDEGTQALPFASVDLYEIAKETVSQLAPHAQASGIRLTLKEGEPVKISGVQRLLAEMIGNLCSNAVKYNQPGGFAEVSVEKEDDRAVLTVRDNGIGIPQEQQSRVFERFYRVDKSRSKETGGTGLGLSIVKHAAILHHASIDLQSKEGEGTTIRIVFPKTES